MKLETFMKYMAALSMNYSKDFFNPKDKDQRDIWYNMLKDIPDDIFAKGIVKLMSIEVFTPKIADIRRYCAEVAAPILVDDTEAWGLVTEAIRKYGYMREQEAIQSLPKTVREAVMRVGGYQCICSAENTGVIRGQFNKVMEAINTRDKTARNTSSGLNNALLQLSCTEEPLSLEDVTYTRSKAEITAYGMQSIRDTLASQGLLQAYDLHLKEREKQLAEDKKKREEFYESRSNEYIG